MSRGLGWVQQACLVAIKEAEEDGERGMRTYDIIAKLYRLDADAEGYLPITDAQHVAVRRALLGLQKQKRVIGLRLGGNIGDGRADMNYRWMTAVGLARTIADEKEQAKDTIIWRMKLGTYKSGDKCDERLKYILARAKEVGIK